MKSLKLFHMYFQLNLNYLWWLIIYHIHSTLTFLCWLITRVWVHLHVALSLVPSGTWSLLFPCLISLSISILFQAFSKDIQDPSYNISNFIIKSLPLKFWKHTHYTEIMNTNTNWTLPINLKITKITEYLPHVYYACSFMFYSVYNFSWRWNFF